MTATKPFTVRKRQRITDRYGHRPVNDWGDGDLPAPWAEGDVVELVGERNDRIDSPARFQVVCSAFSVDEGDGWYFRVSDGEFYTSDRLHVAYADRSTFNKNLDYMAPFVLVETADPDGLALRERMLDGGWEFEPTPKCETCGKPL